VLLAYPKERGFTTWLGAVLGANRSTLDKRALAMSVGRPMSGSVGRAPVAGVELKKAICDRRRLQAIMGNCAPIERIKARVQCIVVALGHNPELLGSTKQISAMLTRHGMTVKAGEATTTYTLLRGNARAARGITTTADEANHLVTTFFGPPVLCAHLEDLVAKDEKERATPADVKRKRSRLRSTRMILTSPGTIAALAHDKIAQEAEEAAVDERRKARAAKKAAKAAVPKPAKKPSKKAQKAQAAAAFEAAADEAAAEVVASSAAGGGGGSASASCEVAAAGLGGSQAAAAAAAVGSKRARAKSATGRCACVLPTLKRVRMSQGAAGDVVFKRDVVEYEESCRTPERCAPPGGSV